MAFAGLVHALQESNTAFDALGIFAGHARKASALQTDGDVEGLVALRAEFVKADILTDFDAAADLGAHLFDDADLFFQDVLFQTEIRDAV